ncbi:MAG: sigma-54 dependent transcriptional regulator [Ignavibacteria bacterium]|nr:sigma-54 dependent transcriptional regulator [Ignavibacteria bacterium]
MNSYQEIQEKYTLFFRSSLMKEMVDIIKQVASTDITVLIYGESGVGKENVARAIHGLSRRSNEKLLTVNCGAIPEGIIESELFGHQKGAFTGAIESRKGYFELADGGTLFLDEIGELPIATQVKFLRVLETKEFLRVGAESTTKIDVRFITATNKDLTKEIEKKKFREDLYYRLKSVMIEVPPLRKRREDIPLLIDRFIKDFCQRNNRELATIDSEALDFLIEYNWPGNVRELKNTIESAVALNKDGLLKISDFEKNIFKNAELKDSRNLPVFLNKSSEEAERELIYRALFEIKKDLIDIKNFLANKKEIKNDITEGLSIQHLQKEAIKNALIKTNYNKKKAAELLNMSLRTLYRKIKEYQLKADED